MFSGPWFCRASHHIHSTSSIRVYPCWKIISCSIHPVLPNTRKWVQCPSSDQFFRYHWNDVTHPEWMEYVVLPKFYVFVNIFSLSVSTASVFFTASGPPNTRRMSSTIEEFTLPNHQPVSLLDCKTAFDALTKKEKLYAHYLSRACWAGSPITQLQVP